MRETVLRPPSGKLTAAFLDGLAVPAGIGRVTVKDCGPGAVQGLELRASATGARAWAVSRRVAGKQRRFTLEGGGRLSLADARKGATRVLRLLDQGVDPTGQKRAARLAAAEEKPTLREVIERYGAALTRHAKSWPARKGHLLREYRRHLDQPADRLSPADLLAVLDAARARGAPVSGRAGLRYLAPVLRWAARRRLIPANPVRDLDPELVAECPRERPRDRVLSKGEVARLWAVLEASPDVRAKAMQLILLTGQRLGEVLDLRWADLDLDRGEWVQTANKSGRRHVVPLSGQAVRVIEAMPRRAEHVFVPPTGRKLGSTTGNWPRVTKRFGDAAGITEHWQRHDLRRTCASLLAELGVQPVVIEMLLNHSPRAVLGRIGSIYNRHGYGPEMREAVDRLGEHVAELAAGRERKVVPLWR